MKKVLLSIAIALCMASCTTVHKTAVDRNVAAPIVAATTADLDVSEVKITYTYVPSREVARGGYRNVKNMAITEALRVNGGGDVLVECQQEVVEYRGLFKKKIDKITVTGYPAKYKNFKSIDKETLNRSFENGLFPTVDMKR
ncbi:MAG: hypothetical protein IJ250_03455 [Bacteroidales bacterium]|nr:hypothetical protein [Bacteroidales bacterium]